MARKKKEELVPVESTNDNILLQSRVETDIIREDLKNYVDDRITETFINEIDKANKKLLREKSRRLFWKNIVIVILLLLVGFLTYLLYSYNYFDKFFNKENTQVETKEETKQEEKKEDVVVTPSPKPTVAPTPKITPTPTPKVPTLDELKKEYASLLDNFYVTDNSLYLKDFYDGNLTNDMKKYFTLNAFDFSTFDKEDDYNIIKDSTFKLMYEKLFNTNYTASSFNYDDNKIRYVKSIDSYMSDVFLVRDENNIQKEIKNIQVDGGEVIITTIEGIVKDNKLYNIISNEEVTDYKEDSLLKYEDKLNKVVYTFKNNKLINLSK